MILPNLGSKTRRRFFITVSQEEPLWRLLKMAQPMEQRGSISVARKTKDLRNVCLHFMVLTVNPNFAMTIEDATTERPVSLVTHEQNGRFRATDVSSQMVLDPSGGAHSRRRHNDGRFIFGVDRL